MEQGEKGGDVLELVNAVHPLGLLLRVHKTAERRPELLAARAVRHAAQARAVPVDLARLGVEGALLARLVLERLRGARLGSGPLCLLRLGLVLLLLLLL